MAIQYSINTQNLPQSFPIVDTTLVFMGDGTTTTCVVDFASDPFNISLNRKNTPSGATVGQVGSVVNSFSFDASSLKLTIDFSTAVGAGNNISIPIQLFYTGE